MAKGYKTTVVSIRLPNQVVEELRATAEEEGLTLTELCQGRLMRVQKHYLRRYKKMAQEQRVSLIQYLSNLRLSHP